MKTLRICMVVQNNYSIDPRVRRKARAQINAGNLVHIIALREKKGQWIHYDNGVKIYSIPLRKARSTWVRYLWEYLIFWAFAAIYLTFLHMWNFYSIIEINTIPDILVFAAVWPKMLGVKIVLDMHEPMPEFFMSKFGVVESHWVVRLIKFQERISVEFADGVIVINEPIREVLSSRGLSMDDAVVVLNSADEHTFLQEKERNRKQIKDEFIFMYHGTLTSMYGLDIALRSFAIAVPKMMNAKFWIIGEGPERSSLENLSSELGLHDKVRFLGVVHQDEIPMYLRMADVGVLPTRSDQFLNLSLSNKLSEYIISEKPVIASRINTVNYYFSDDALMYFEPNNVPDLTRKMFLIYSNEKLRRKLVRSSMREYSRISWQVMRDRYMKIIEAHASPS